MAEINPAQLVGIGTDLIAVKEHNGQVVIQLPEGASWAALDKETARQFAETVARCAYKAHYGVDTPSSRSVFTTEKRNVLVRRIEIMLGGFMRKTPVPSFKDMSNNIVDTVLSDVL